VELNWTTFSLEILNFLVLVWILQHFLYKPVLDVIAARRAKIEKTLVDAKAIEAGAQALKTQYESRQAEWQQEKDAARAKLAQEIITERGRLTAGLELSLAEQREKARVLEERQRKEWRGATEAEAIAHGAVFAARLLTRVATPELEAKLLDVTLEDLRQFPADRARTLASGTGTANLTANVASAYRVDEERRKTLGSTLAMLLGEKLAIYFSEDPDLLAGIRVNVGSWVLHANLRDELKFFSAAGGRAG
jgi:F-type H+-transporting ATPase subunit b